MAEFGHVLDQPGDVERVADDAGGADQAALAAGEFGELAQPGVGLERHAENRAQRNYMNGPSQIIEPGNDREHLQNPSQPFLRV